MSDVVSTFPLLRLPKNAILCTFRTMSILKTFGTSLLSKKAKNLVKTLKLKGYTLQVDVTHILQVYVLSPNSAAVLSFQLYCARENQQPKIIDTPRNIYSVGFMWRVKWANSMRVKQILDHLRFIFHNPTTVVAFGPNSERFSLEQGCQKLTASRGRPAGRGFLAAAAFDGFFKSRRPAAAS